MKDLLTISLNILQQPMNILQQPISQKMISRSLIHSNRCRAKIFLNPFDLVAIDILFVYVIAGSCVIGDYRSQVLGNKSKRFNLFERRRANTQPTHIQRWKM